jgi:hypothetical protein
MGVVGTGKAAVGVVFHRVANPHCWGPALSEPDLIVSRVKRYQRYQSGLAHFNISVA